MSTKQERSATLRSEAPQWRGTMGSSVSTKQERSATLAKPKPAGRGTGGAA